MALSLNDIEGLNAFRLAADDLADCGIPDSPDSEGARLLVWVRDEIVEKVRQDPDATENDLQDAVHEIADAAPSVYTYALWAQFVDLAAYLEEPETGEWPDDLTRAAAIALYQIADRLCHRIIDEYLAWRDEQGDDDSE